MDSICRQADTKSSLPVRSCLSSDDRLSRDDCLWLNSELTEDVARLMEWRLSKEERWASLLNSGMETLEVTKPRTVSQGANTSEEGSAWSGVMVMMDRW